jgi:hypothetical protein
MLYSITINRTEKIMTTTTAHDPKARVTELPFFQTLLRDKFYAWYEFKATCGHDQKTMVNHHTLIAAIDHAISHACVDCLLAEAAKPENAAKFAAEVIEDVLRHGSE